MHSCLQTAETSTDIVIIQEPWIGTNSDGKNYFSISHPSFLMLISPTTHCPRTLTYVSNTTPYLKAALQPDICSDEDIQVIKISTPNLEPVYLINIVRGDVDGYTKEGDEVTSALVLFYQATRVKYSFLYPRSK